MKGGAVALDGRIDPGDMILQVNEIGFDNMSNDDAVRVLKEVVQKPGPIKLVVAKVIHTNCATHQIVSRIFQFRNLNIYKIFSQSSSDCFEQHVKNQSSFE